MKSISRATIARAAAAALLVPSVLAASDPCTDLCEKAGSDLMYYAGWEVTAALQVVVNCVKGCQSPAP